MLLDAGLKSQSNTQVGEVTLHQETLSKLLCHCSGII